MRRTETKSSRSIVVLSVAAWGYFCVLWLCLGLRFAFDDGWWWLGFLNSFTPYWFGPLIVIVPAVCFTRLRWLQFSGLVCLAVFLLLFGRLFAPKMSSNEPGRPTITVMSYNILGSNQNWSAIRDTIWESGADVIALQELNAEIAAKIQSELSESYPYQVLDSQDSLISRYPVTLTDVTLPGSWGTLPKVYQLDLNGHSVTVINAHFYASFLNFDRPFMNWVFQERERQAQFLTDFARQVDTPLIVTADFNATDQGRAHRIVTSQLVDSWREAGWGFGHTFPGGPSSPGIGRPVIAGYPIPMWVVRIDYIFHSDAWVATEARLGKWDGVSDHRPVIAVLQLQL